jgi:hypothetical protein
VHSPVQGRHAGSTRFSFCAVIRCAVTHFKEAWLDSQRCWVLKRTLRPVFFCFSSLFSVPTLAVLLCKRRNKSVKINFEKVSINGSSIQSSIVLLARISGKQKPINTFRKPVWLALRTTGGNRY